VLRVKTAVLYESIKLGNSAQLNQLSFPSKDLLGQCEAYSGNESSKYLIFSEFSPSLPR
jgi:hypothetical protein